MTYGFAGLPRLQPPPPPLLCRRPEPMLSSNLPNSKADVESWFLSGQVHDAEGVRKIVIPGYPCQVGRGSSAWIQLNCNSISKIHCEFQLIDGKIALQDLASTNGTFINGKRLGSEPELLKDGDLIQFATLVFRLGCGSSITETRTMRDDSCDRALAMMQFDRLMNDGGMIPFFQPIVSLQNLDTIGYEVLGRSRLFGLRTPAEMFSAASKFNLEAELSREMRYFGVQLADQNLPPINIFVNTHPCELVKPGLRESLEKLRELAPKLPIVVEIHEAAVTNPESFVALRRHLASLDIQLAFDDFGAGRARLVELSEVRPDYVKFDMELVRDIHLAPPKRQEVVALIVKMVNDLGIISLAEGVESADCHEVLKQMNVALGQGYYYGRPASIDSWTRDQEPGNKASDTDRSDGLISPNS